MGKRPAPKLPAFLFYPGDWKKDTQLSKCSLAARGAWIELLCAMHENGRTGIVTGTIEELAQICRCSEPEMRRALRELQRSKTAVVETSASHRVTFASQKRHTLQNVTGNVTVINRRMDREHKDRTSSKLRTRKWRAKLAGDAVGDENVTAPSSWSSSKEEDLVSKKNRKEEGLRCESEDPPPVFFSEEFFDNLQDQKKFQHFDVREVFGKWKNHCQVSGKELDPKYFLNWLNRERGDLRNASSDEEISRIVARLS